LRLGSKLEKRRGEDEGMVAYEFYWRDETERTHFIGLLPERRGNPERITSDSILNWGRKVIGNPSDLNNIYFVQVEF
jgi:hypothetical protein